MAVHEAKVKTDNKKEKLEDSKELLDQLSKDFHKKKIDNKGDFALQKEIDTLALKLAENPANSDAKVMLHDDIVAFFKTKKKRVCWSCRLSNCFTKQTCSMKLKLHKKFTCKCKGKQITFKELKETKPLSPTATAQITSPASADSDSDTDDIAHAFTDMSTPQTQNDEFGFRENVAEYTVDRIVNEETIPKYEKLAETEIVADKCCLICLKGNMDLWHLSHHLTDYYTIAFFGEENDDPASAWIFVATEWKENGYTYSGSENEVSENNSDDEPQGCYDTDTDIVSHLPPAIIQERHSDSSTDSSSGNTSNSKSKKKSKTERNYKNLSAKIEATRQQNEARFTKRKPIGDKNYI
jgi:hypothetical protein